MPLSIVPSPQQQKDVSHVAPPARHHACAGRHRSCGPPGLPPWRLALVTIMQFRENLADRQASEAVRARIDWKYLLSLDLTDPGFDFSVLSEFRDRLLAGRARSEERR